MSDFSVRSDNVDVEQVMRQIRSRIREKRGVDYTEEEIRELANVKLEKFIDPKGVRSDLLQQYRSAREASLPPNYKFEDTTLYETHRGFLRFMRRLLNPILKLFVNPTPVIEALHIQSKLNARHAAMEPLHYELMHNLVIELTRTSIELKNLKMRLESMASRLDFDERRARALEGVVQYRPGAVPPLQVPTGQEQGRREGRQDGRRDQPRRDMRASGPSAPPSSAPAPSAAGQPVPASANALDNDGNERRARRRRRRGRRRPDDRPGEVRGARPEDRGPTGEDRGVMGGERPGPVAADGAIHGSAQVRQDTPERTSDVGSRSSDRSASGGGSDAVPPDSPPE